jgi:hypothetical protein
MITDKARTTSIHWKSVGPPKIGLAAVLAFILLLVLACGKADRNISEDLLGVWVTDHPQYRDRFLQLSADTITFGWGAGEVASYAVTSIENEKNAAGTLICVHYRDLEQNDYQVSFGHLADGDGQLWMKNQEKIIWLRDQTASIHEPHYR